MKKTTVVLAVAALFVAGIKSVSYGNGSSGPAMQNNGNNSNEGQRVISLYDQGMDATRANHFQEAMELFDKALKEDPKNPDILNMLAHSQRKEGHIDDAIANYKRALNLRPNFPEAREYLGEAYIQAALREMSLLKDYGDKGKEQLEDLTDAFKDAAKKL